MTAVPSIDPARCLLLSTVFLTLPALAIVGTSGSTAATNDRSVGTVAANELWSSAGVLPTREYPKTELVEVGQPDLATTIKLSDAAEKDLRTAAEATGVPYEELLRRNIGSDEFSRAIESIESAHPEAILETRVDADGAYTVDVGTDLEVEQVAKQFSAVPAPVTVIRRIDATSEQIAYQKETFFAALAAAPQTAGTEVDYDASRRLLIAEVAVADPSLVPEVHDLAKRVLDQIRLSYPTRELVVPVELQTRIGRNHVQLKGYRGGRKLRRTSDDVGLCTGGFTAQRGGVKGLITAKHCENSLNYQSENVMTFVAGATNPSAGVIDLQFHKFDSGTVDARFRATGTGVGDDRPVEIVANASIGQTVCAWGAFGGYACTLVADTDMCANFGDGEDKCGLDRATSEITIPGDSGGPWFFSNTARGTLTGAINYRDYFTRIGRVSNNLGATVLKN